MKILKNERSGNIVKLEIESTVDQLKSAQASALKEAMKEISLPGFRKGKAPKHLVENAVDKEFIKSRATQNLIESLYPQVLKETKLEPVDYPKVDIVKEEAGQPLVFSIEIEVYPEVKLGKYKGIKASKKATAVTDEDVNKVIEQLQDRFARFQEKKDGVVAEHDLVDVDIEAKEGDREFPPLTRKGIKLLVGRGGISEDFDKQLEGMKLGETKEFTLDFKADHPFPEVAGKKISFKAQVSKLSTKESIALDDEFAKKVSRLNTVDELKQQIRSNLEIEKKQNSEADVRNKLIEEIVKETNIDIPRSMINREVDIMLDEMAHSLSQSNLTLEAYLKSVRKEEHQIRQEMQTPAKSRVEAKVVLRAISKQEEIKVEEKDIDQELSKIAVNAGKTLAEFKPTVPEGNIEFIEDYLLRQKALDFVLEKAKVKEED